jgi:hypothetical protein
MQARTKRSGAAGARKGSAAKDLTIRKDAKGGIIAVLTGLGQVAAGDVNGDDNALKLKR